MMVSKRKSWGQYDFNLLRLISEDFSLGMPTNVEPKLRCKIFTLDWELNTHDNRNQRNKQKGKINLSVQCLRGIARIYCITYIFIILYLTTT